MDMQHSSNRFDHVTFSTSTKEDAYEYVRLSTLSIVNRNLLRPLHLQQLRLITKRKRPPGKNDKTFKLFPFYHLLLSSLNVRALVLETVAH